MGLDHAFELYSGQQWAQALQLLDVMGRRAVAPNVVSYNSAITACGTGQQWAQALQLLDVMGRYPLNGVGGSREAHTIQ
jgi:hypothetical protein